MNDEKHTIDCEPTWKQMLDMIGRTNLNPDVLEPAVRIADHVRQAQKSGAKSVTFRFNKVDNLIAVEVEE